MEKLQPNLFFPFAGVAAVASFASCSNKQKPVEQKPLNIVYIMTDDHTAQMMSCYDTRYMETPNLDRIAADGVRFTQSFVANSLSGPSRACMITGKHSCANKFYDNTTCVFDSSQQTFPKLLQKIGYQTALVGKWHLESLPSGFNYWEIVPGQGDYYNPEFKSKESNGKYVKEEGYATTLTTDHAIEFLEERDKDKPFCLLVHHKAPHRNWMPDTKYMDLYEDVEFPYPDTFNDNYATRCDAARTQEMSIDKNMTLVYDLKVDELKDKEAYKKEWNIDGWQASLDRMTPEQREAWIASYKPRNEKFINENLKGEDLVKWKYQRYIKDYVRCIKSIDDEVGRLIAYLEKEGLMDNTVIVYTSDQGFYMGEHGWFDKRFMYEESFRTPLIIRYPAKIKAGSECTALVQNIDYAPTYLDIAGIEKPDYMVGTSLVPLFGGETPKDWREYLYYHYYDYPAIHMVRRHDGVRDSRYKLIHFYGEKNEHNDAISCNELYDLQSDPNELNNLYDNPEYADIQTRLQARLDKFRVDQKVDEY